MKQLLISFLLMACFSTFLSAQGVQTVVVEGEGVGKDNAVYSALRLAVEQVGGVQIQSSSATQDFVLVKDVILAEARGFVTNFDILEEQRGPDGIYWVRIRATVNPSGIASRCDAIAGLLRMKGYPKILVDIPESIDGQPNTQRMVEHKIKALLKAKESRMNVMIFQDLDAMQQREIQIAREKGDRSVVEQMARRIGYDIIIRGDSRVYKAESKVVRGMQKIVYNISVVSDAVRIDSSSLVATAEILRRNAQRNMPPTEVHQDLVRLAGEEFADRMFGLIIKDWIDDVNRFMHTTLYCTGVEFGDLDFIEQALTNAQGVQGFQQKGFDDDQVEYQIQLKGDANNFAKQLNKARLDSGRVLKIKSVKGNILRAVAEHP